MIYICAILLIEHSQQLLTCLSYSALSINPVPCYFMFLGLQCIAASSFAFGRSENLSLTVNPTVYLTKRMEGSSKIKFYE
ncbi:hypothetical protein BJ912DRAFT_251324 [Pholiota molesta]|nr:hypothetical protein BJ912DRAFT_251324 [Pholiota molesta]